MMFSTDFVAKALHRNHEPIINSPLQQDFYKFPMAHFIRTYYPNTRSTFKLTVRNKNFPLALIVREEDLRRELDNARHVTYGNSDLYYMHGMNIGNRHMFGNDGSFFGFLKGFDLPPYDLRRVGTSYELSSSGPWEFTTFWEMPMLAILNELKSRAITEHMSKVELSVYYARATDGIYNDLVTLRNTTSLPIVNFGLRRHDSFDWEMFVCQMAREVLGRRFTGISTVSIAKDLQVEPKGTNAHELYMGAVADASRISPEAMRSAPYDTMRKWESLFNAMLILLPDAYGTQWMLDNMPQDLAEHVAHSWAGFRWDSGGMITEGERQLAFYKKYGVDPVKTGKIGIPSDGLDVPTMQEIDRHFKGKIALSCGWGTNLTNKFKGCHPRGNEQAILWGTPVGLTWDEICGGQSMVVKLEEIGGSKAVKFSNNIEKATGDMRTIEYYKGVFGYANQISEPVLV